MAPKGNRGRGSGSKAAGHAEHAAMHKNEISKMLGYLNYHSMKHEREDCKHALQVYEQLPSDKKREFLSKFKHNKKDLAWVKSLTVTESASVLHQHQLQEGWFLRSEILEMNGFAAHAFSKEDAQSLLEDLLLQAETEHAYERQVAKHPSNELLHKYYYIKGKGKVHTEEGRSSIEQKDVLSGSGASSSAAQLQLVAPKGVPGSSKQEEVAVKVENKSHAKMVELLKKLRTAKTQLVRLQSDAEDTFAEMEIKAEKDASLSNQVKKLGDCLSALKTFLGELRNLISRAAAKPSDVDAEKEIEEIEYSLLLAESHVDGLRALHKRYKALLHD